MAPQLKDTCMKYRVIDHNPIRFNGEPAHDQNFIVTKGNDKQHVITDARNKYGHVSKTTLHLERKRVVGKWEQTETIEVGM
jgi:hypothetical protein